MRILVVILLVLCVAIPLTGCARNVELQPVASRDFIFSNFTNLETDSKTRDFLVFGNTISVPVELVVTRSDSYKVSLSANQNIFDFIQVSQSGETLKITVDNVKIANRDAIIKADIAMPELKSLKINHTSMQASLVSSAAQFNAEVANDSRLNIDLQSGPAVFNVDSASDVTVRGVSSALDADISGASKFNCNLKTGAQTLNVSSASDIILRGTAQTLQAAVSGSSSLDLDQQLSTAALKLSSASDCTGKIAGSSLNIDLSGSSRADLSGTTANAVLKASGASDIALADMAVDTASVTLSGASDGKLQVADRLEIDLSGASDLRYHGSPLINNVKVSGDSNVQAY